MKSFRRRPLADVLDATQVRSIGDSHCLVIGGAGNLGGHLVRLLLETGAKSVASFDILPYSGLNAEKVESFTGDITDYEAVLNSLDNVDTVFHTASIIDIRPQPSLRMHAVNVDGTFNVIRACKAAMGVRTLIYTSSLEVVSGTMADGTVAKLDGVDESVPIPASHNLPYAATKAEAERLILAANSTELRTCSVRPGYIVGPGSIGMRMEMARAKQRSDRYVSARVPAKISSVHPRNAALAHLLAAEQIEHPSVNGCCFFIKDFDANVVEMALDAFSRTPIQPLMLPLQLAYSLAWMLDRCDRLVHWWAGLWGREHTTTSDEVLDIKAVNMAYIDIIVSAERSQQILGYAPLVSKDECFEEARKWCEGAYAGLE